MNQVLVSVLDQLKIKYLIGRCNVGIDAVLKIDIPSVNVMSAKIIVFTFPSHKSDIVPPKIASMYVSMA